MNTRKTLDLPVNLLEWYADEYPKVALSTLVVMLLNNFRQIHEDTGVTPNKVAHDAAKEVKEQLESGDL